MPTRQVCIVVDGAIDLAPETVEELGIIVIPRTSKLGWSHQELTSEYTGYSLSQRQARPRNIVLTAPSRTTCVAAYQQALTRGDHIDILSIHMPDKMDAAVASVKSARNLMPHPANITVLEVPMLGMGLAWLVEVLARLANPTWSTWFGALSGLPSTRLSGEEAGWTRDKLTSLLRSLQRHMRSLFITPQKFPYRVKLGTDSRKTALKKPLSALGKRMWTVLQAPGLSSDDPLLVLGHHYDITELAAMVRDVVQNVPRLPGVPVDAQLEGLARHANLEALFTELRAAVDLPDEARPAAALSEGWSPAATSCLGRQHIELFYAPNVALLAGLINLTLRVHRDFVDPLAGRNGRRIWEQIDNLDPR